MTRRNIRNNLGSLLPSTSDKAEEFERSGSGSVDDDSVEGDGIFEVDFYDRQNPNPDAHNPLNGDVYRVISSSRLLAAYDVDMFPEED